jgi:hypothetical protein
VELSKVEVLLRRRVDLLMRKMVEDEDAKLPRRHTLGLAWHVKVGWVGCAVVGYGLITCWKLVCGSLSPFTDLRSLPTQQVRLYTFQFHEISSAELAAAAPRRRRRRVTT